MSDDQTQGNDKIINEIERAIYEVEKATDALREALDGFRNYDARKAAMIFRAAKHLASAISAVERINNHEQG